MRTRRRRRIFAMVAAAAALPMVLILLLSFMNPATTMFRLLNPDSTVAKWVDVEHISRHFLITVMGQEDQDLPTRWTAVDPNDYLNRVAAHLAGEEDRSGSTIPQQVAKNLFLWPESDVLRKALEAPLSEEVALLLPNRRILEIYVNTAQFAPHVYGVCAASWYYFDHSSRTLSLDESAMLAGLLPSPLHVYRAPDGGMAFTADANGNGVADPGEAGFISAKGYWHAREHAPRWFEQMGGMRDGRFIATEALGISGRADDLPAADDPCGERPAGLAG
ncbi:transglycosylase domain-containing protein [Pseudonocardia sp. KRD-184]|uniref:Transglycosylase domain-containing protein n=1 Tax=Pseudonocardia oceani TaxID=2792013 RepID=A0ABS6U8A7_9PSEU|nr:transglycosylase domain-containing protein [Pseudonocardia oceani]MBW0088483.1 transglycosylase domain-containing protein [Pseudonocardia oceani]MBW0095375.1 transglycosylase domain-containing protein [Pseudonocardia oceani]MBW0121804.1 transglycosylase domain-containing protein [Pseudonocardia oceani]MBW0128475.1 transglycosylase domain-containing protein [Pseudonocardia oceani]